MARNPPPRFAWLSAHALLVALAPFSLDRLLLRLSSVAMTLVGPRFIEPGVPHRLLHRNLNVITFRYSYARAPQDLGMGRDDRQRSVRFDEIDLVQWSRPRP